MGHAARRRQAAQMAPKRWEGGACTAGRQREPSQPASASEAAPLPPETMSDAPCVAAAMYPLDCQAEGGCDRELELVFEFVHKLAWEEEEEHQEHKRRDEEGEGQVAAPAQCSRWPGRAPLRQSEAPGARRLCTTRGRRGSSTKTLKRLQTAFTHRGGGVRAQPPPPAGPTSWTAERRARRGLPRSGARVGLGSEDRAAIPRPRRCCGPLRAA
ncbi:unnamed protein product [Prorocentrum cordatum]|uniref:Uncharacterized protein n=1 Tax=Prorocentrum cordatum TaxID=2364126 RepID=A0ABN9WUK2_9DINO|nr:unnamed protein product [Polarella glacialis]